MAISANIDAIYIPSEDIVARLIQGELIIVPLTSGIGDMEDELYSLNETGREIWDRLDGRTSLRQIAETLAKEYEADPAEITQDVLSLMEELVSRKIVVETGGI